MNSSKRGINMEHDEMSRRRSSFPFNYIRYWILIGKGLINPFTILRTRNVRRCSPFIKFYFHPDRDMKYFRNSVRLRREYFFNENDARRYFDEWKRYIFENKRGVKYFRSTSFLFSFYLIKREFPELSILATLYAYLVVTKY